MSKVTKKRLDEMVFKLNATTPEEMADALFDARESREAKMSKNAKSKEDKMENKKGNKKANKMEGLTTAYFGSQDAPAWEDRVGFFSPGSKEFCVGILDGREGEVEEAAVVVDAYDKALTAFISRKTGRPVSDCDDMPGEEWDALVAEWSPQMTKRERRLIEESVQQALAEFRRERGWQAPEDETRQESGEKMVRALDRKKEETDEDEFSWDDIREFPGTDILTDFFDKEGFSYEIQPGFDISYLILDCCGDGWGPIDVRIGSTEGKDLVVLSDPLEVCPPKKQKAMLRLLNRLNSEEHPATVFMEENGEVRVRWNLFCEEENLIPAACEALGRVVERMNEVMPMLWDMLEN